MNFAKFLRTPVFIEDLWWLHLSMTKTLLVLIQNKAFGRKLSGWQNLHVMLTAVKLPNRYYEM